MLDAEKEFALDALRADRPLAHQALFEHRHADPTPSFHEKLISEWHDSWPQRIFMAFRGGAKSTIGEEAFIIRALFREFHNGLILGDNEQRAIEKLVAIKTELETNEAIESLCGVMQGPVWRDTKIVLANGVCIQAVGSGQSLRGTKHLSYRPDCLLVDDVEGDKDVYSPEQREKTRSWFFSVVIPVLSPRSLIRIAATPLDAESLPLILSRVPSWRTSIVPIKSIHPASGEWTAAWPQRYPLSWIDGREAEYKSTGNLAEFQREYMCEATLESEKIFTASMFRDEIMQRGMHPVYMMYDPARTTHQKTSSMTGFAAWSWVSGRLIVWESGGFYWKPDELIDDLFKKARIYRPVLIGVERDGLEEFVMQPLRQKMAAQGTPLPVKGVKAPRGKVDFIKGLQPYFKAGEVVFVGGGHEILKEQLVNFPRGLIDVPNALAYALTLRPAEPVYPEFQASHIMGNLNAKAQEPVWCILNADQQTCTVQAFQFFGGRVRLLFDDVLDGPRGDAVPALLSKISLEFGRSVRAMAPPRHFKDHDVLGLRPAAAQTSKVVVRHGGEPIQGSLELRRLLRAEGLFQIGMRASWSIRALQGGYTADDRPGEGLYSLLAEGLETFCGRLTLALEERSANLRYEHTPDGREYLSSRA